MIKKIGLGLLLAGLITVLVIGAVNRTQAKSGNDFIGYQDTMNNQGQGNAVGRSGDDATEPQGQGLRQGGTNQQSGGQSSGKNRQTEGESSAEEGFRGGRDVVQGETQVAQGNGRRYQGGNNAGAANSGEPVAEVQEWITLQGSVQNVSTEGLMITLSDGSTIEVSSRAWTYAQQQGFQLNPGDLVELSGFYDESTGEYEAGSIKNLSTGQIVTLREDSGRPMWAGGGRRGG